MASKYAVRWRPAAYRSTIEAIIVNRTPGDPDANPPVPAASGQRVQVLQLIVFNDASFGAGNPYRPGDPQTEQHLAIVDEVPIFLEVSAFAGLTNAQAQALWDTARDEQRARWEAQPDIMALVKAAIGGHLSPYVVVG